MDVIKAHITWLVETLEIDLIPQKPELRFLTESLNFLNVGTNLPYVALLTYLYARLLYYMRCNWIFFLFFRSSFI